MDLQCCRHREGVPARLDGELPRRPRAAKAGFGDDPLGFAVVLTKRVAKHREGLADDVLEPILAPGDFPYFPRPVEPGEVGMTERVRADFVPRGEHPDTRL